MKRLKQVLTALVAGVLASFALQATAATVEVEWGDPAQFRDIRSTNAGQKKFQARVMEEIEQQFRREAAMLDAGQTLHVAVQDLDLAGEIEYFHANYPQGLRVIRNVDSPSLDLRYELRDADGAVLQSGEERVRDLGFRFSTLAPLDRSPLRYEKALVSAWYDRVF